jgi:hypothetical protein
MDTGAFMTNRYPKIFSALAILLTLVVALPLFAAQTPVGLAISQVQPNAVGNGTAVELVITGSNFDNGAVVILAGYGALETTFVSSSVLRATLPALVPPGVYAVSVTNPDAVSATLADALTVTAAPDPTATLEPTATPFPTAFVRPLLVVHSYGASSTIISPGEELDFEITLQNAGQSTATNIVATFVSGDFAARATGGVRAVEALAAGQASRFFQPITASRDIAGKSLALLEVRVSYTDLNGNTYSETFSLTFPVVRPPASGPAPTATATPTPTATPTNTPTATAAPRLRPQVIITDYSADVVPLQPGARFTLQLNLENQGNADARRVTMILGGGTISGGSSGGTPEAGGVAGAGGEFGNFAPVGSSNVQFIGDLAQGATLQAHQSLIVNASAQAGAYPVKLAFVYTDAAGASFSDEQVITLLVYQLPLVEMNFYSDPPAVFAGERAPLPLQIINLGRRSVMLGNFKVSGEDAQFMNNNIFVGSLEAGGYFPLDAMVIPAAPGNLALILSVEFTDDFNQPQVISRSLTLEVMEGFVPEPFEPEPGYYEPPPAGNETALQKLWRFILGMIGLSSGLVQQSYDDGPGPVGPPEPLGPPEYFEPRG